MSYKYNEKQLEQMGRIYGYLLHVLNENGHDPYPNSDVFPFKYITIMIPKAMRVGIPTKLNKEIGNLMDDLNANDTDIIFDTPVPMNMRQHFVIGCMRYQDIDKDHPITEVRKKNGLSQKELADKIGVTQKDISRWENNINRPNAESLSKLAAALNCKMEDLMC